MSESGLFYSSVPRANVKSLTELAASIEIILLAVLISLACRFVSGISAGFHNLRTEFVRRRNNPYWRQHVVTANSFPPESAEPDHRLGLADQKALRAAKSDGWLKLTPELSPATLTIWQNLCERAQWPFAVVRPEPTRAIMWLILQPGREWTEQELQHAHGVLSKATGAILTSGSARSFLKPADVPPVMRELVSLARGSVGPRTAAFLEPT